MQPYSIGFHIEESVLCCIIHVNAVRFFLLLAFGSYSTGRIATRALELCASVCWVLKPLAVFVFDDSSSTPFLFIYHNRIAYAMLNNVRSVINPKLWKVWDKRLPPPSIGQTSRILCIGQVFAARSECFCLLGLKSATYCENMGARPIKVSAS
jgi:hypothetical protein